MVAKLRTNDHVTVNWHTYISSYYLILLPSELSENKNKLFRHNLMRFLMPISHAITWHKIVKSKEKKRGIVC